MKTHVECEIRHMGKGLMGKKDLWMGPSLGTGWPRART